MGNNERRMISPTHLTRTVRSMYQNTTTIMMKGSSLAPVLFNLSNVKVIKDGLQVIKQNILMKAFILNTATRCLWQVQKIK
jgi:hypothetical protein